MKPHGLVYIKLVNANRNQFVTDKAGIHTKQIRIPFIEYVTEAYGYKHIIRDYLRDSDFVWTNYMC